MIKLDGYRPVFLYVFVIFLYSPPPSMADARNTETPTVLDGGKIISATEAKHLLDKENFFLADCRSAFNFGKGHIPTAKLISYQHIYKKQTSGSKPTLKNIDISKLPDAKDSIIIFIVMVVLDGSHIKQPVQQLKLDTAVYFGFVED